MHVLPQQSRFLEIILTSNEAQTVFAYGQTAASFCIHLELRHLQLA